MSTGVPVVQLLVEGLAGQGQLHVGETQLQDETGVVRGLLLELGHLCHVTGNDHLIRDNAIPLVTSEALG